MTDKVPIDANYEELDKIYTIDEVAEKLQIDQASILFYFEKLNDFLKIASVGAFQVFSESDIKNIERIRHLDKDLNMSIHEIKKYLQVNKQEVLLSKDDAKSIDINVFGQLMMKLCETINNQNVKIDNLMEQLSTTNVNVENIIKGQAVINNKVDDLEISITREFNSKMDDIKDKMEQRKIESEKQNHSWMYKLFHKRSNR